MDAPYTCDITFAERVRIFTQEYLKYCKFLTDERSTPGVISKKLYAALISNSQLLEDFLDFHGAKNNSDWYFFRELSAAVRHLSLACYSQKHILNRLVYYDLVNMENFKREGETTFAFLTNTLKSLAPIIIEEARRLNIPEPAEAVDITIFPEVVTADLLPYDIDDDNRDQQKKHIVNIASEFIRIAKTLDQFRFYEAYGIEEIRSIVPDKINEVEVRRFEMLVHNLQSSFDTYVIHGGYRFGNRKLKQLRGNFSAVFHLLQVMGRLLHFYERHLYDAGYKNTYKQVQERLALLVDAEALLDRTINYGLYFTCHFLNIGTKLAGDILNENIERGSIVVGIPVKLGFHSRPSLLLAKIVQHYGGQVELVVGQDRFDASSVLDIQWAGGKIQKENLDQVRFEGDVRALEDIEILAGVNYGEDTIGKGVPLPRELKYLK
ncbi:MAG: HPr family phosphocarrier protein [Desulfobacterales bacterium]